MNVWPAVFTPEVLQNLHSEGEIAFRQNYMLIPYKSGEAIIARSSLRFADSYPKDSRIVFGIDPAFSEKTESDSMAITICGHYGVEKYIIASYEMRGKEKNEETFVPFVESLYHKYQCSNIVIESNNGGLII